MAACLVCHSPHDTYLCNSCHHGLSAELESLTGHWRTDRDGQALPGLAEELDVTAGRQDHIGGQPLGIVTHTADHELPINLAAVRVHHALRNCLVTWVRDLWERNQIPGSLLDCADTVPELAAWLLRHPTWIAGHDAANKLHADITRHIRAADRAIDRPPDRVFCGPCNTPNDDGYPCQADLYAKPNADTVTCRDCGAQHDVEARRDWLLQAAHDCTGTSTEVANFVTWLGVRCTTAMIRNYVDRGRLMPHGTNYRGHPLYLVGSVHALALAAQQRRKAS